MMLLISENKKIIFDMTSGVSPSTDSNERESTRALIGRFNPRSRQSGRFESLDSPKLFNFEIRENLKRNRRTERKNNWTSEHETNTFLRE